MKWLRRIRFAATPAHAWPAHLRKAVGRTRLGSAVKRRRVVGPPPSLGVTRAVRPRRRGGRNVLLISHCDFTGNSAYHVHSLARELAGVGWSTAVAVPGSARGARELGRASFPIVSYRAVRRGGLRFPDGSPPDLVHAFTPRAGVRALTHDVGAPYVVHLEDNEAVVDEALREPAAAGAADAFVAGAVGVTVVIERLTELAPDGLPARVVWPGYDEELDRAGRPRDLIRADLGFGADDLAVVYTGNVHEANIDDVSALYGAIARARRDGLPVVLMKTGWNSVPDARLPHLGRALRDLGWIRRDRVRELVRAADILVQPGRPGPFDDYRFPSKLPDFLASGHPVVLPRTNIGLHLEHGVHALLLDDGDENEILAAVARLARDPELCRTLGTNGRAFARSSLRWSAAGAAVADLYSGWLSAE